MAGWGGRRPGAGRPPKQATARRKQVRAILAGYDPAPWDALADELNRRITDPDVQRWEARTLVVDAVVQACALCDGDPSADVIAGVRSMLADGRLLAWARRGAQDM